MEAVYKETLRWAVPVPLSVSPSSSLSPAFLTLLCCVDLPHRLMEDDVYDGMFIPKGSLVFGNIWCGRVHLFLSHGCGAKVNLLFVGQCCAMRRYTLMQSHSSQTGSSSRARLSRSARGIRRIMCLDSEGGMYSISLWFRLTDLRNRQCPGENLIHSSIWLVMVSMLATLDISKAVDGQGNVVEPEIKFENPIFRCVGG